MRLSHAAAQRHLKRFNAHADIMIDPACIGAYIDARQKLRSGVFILVDHHGAPTEADEVEVGVPLRIVGNVWYAQQAAREEQQGHNVCWKQRICCIQIV